MMRAVLLQTAGLAAAVIVAGPASAQDTVGVASSHSTRGTWELDAGASAHERVIGETVVIGGDDTQIDYAATVRFQGKTTGVRFKALVDGPEVPLVSLGGVTVGRARVRRVDGGRTITELMPDSGVQRIIEHRASIDGQTLLSLLYDKTGKVLSILVFRRTA
ncbi:hypothetical protein [Sphingobium ummariense]|uniref:DUF306 domain-containing protein n=1 Tax=Sphingobium ummariense RL-3 TaxID=1346791 RepID=T0J5W4_9SPHN|nr:hypothetical protein [Sphingobium ummariense]EQB32192.1 hypothetical protein M529_10340 [Sphingobium ummariense RL-3]